MFDSDFTDRERAAGLMHELSHKVISTEDHQYGEEKCLDWAKTGVHRKCQKKNLKCTHKLVDNADSWGFFLAEFC